ncbi:unnamed protein product [Microthlaspi erraticum]|uniref:Replication factor A C-terminal domain-containing protein n=1 Tax=Microthlaspi erraticum TaxID=1685480 RepID=A0A6D2HI83_9BRAS|nr:unnamed protein product [Microthlaspi erraticum]
MHSVYLVSNFEVVPTYNHYKVTDNTLITIRFMDSTQVIEIAEADCSIKKKNVDCTHVVGQVLQVQGPNLDDATSKQKIVLLLLLEAAIGIPRFRVELLVENGGRTSTFVLFDRDARTLTNTTVEDINMSVGNEDQAGGNATDIPICLLELVGKTLDFQIKISEYNFQSSSQTFIVTRVVEEKLTGNEDSDTTNVFNHRPSVQDF